MRLRRKIWLIVSSSELRTLVLSAMFLGVALAGRSVSLQKQPGHPYLQIFCRQFSLRNADVPADEWDRLRVEGAKETSDTRGTLWRASPRGLVEVDASGKERLWTGRDGLPSLRLTAVTSGPDGRLWIGTTEGAVCFQPDEPGRNRWFYFWGRRYLPDNVVKNIVAEASGAWIRTATGISLIEFKPFDLEQKSALFVEHLQQRHIRDGFVADCDLPRPGDISSCRLGPSDNDGLWTGIYLAAECFRFAVTHSSEAQRNARVSLAALSRLESITGIPGFPARALVGRGEYREEDGEWHPTSSGDWEWKGDTSSDELVGHFFAYAVAYDLLADESDRRAIRPVVRRMASHLLEHGFKLVGPNGRITRWGNYSPEYFETPEGKEEAPLSSLELLSHLRVAYHITGEDKFMKAYHRAAVELGYLRNVMRFASETPVVVNYSDEELAFLSFYPLLRLEDDPPLRQQFRRALEGLWRRARSEKNPLWSLIYETGRGTNSQARRDILETLQRIPLDTTSWTVRNSERIDLELLPQRGRFGERQARDPIPPNERAVMKWNGNPFQLDDGDDGRSEDDGAFFLLPYWMGRYHRLLAP